MAWGKQMSLDMQESQLANYLLEQIEKKQMIKNMYPYVQYLSVPRGIAGGRMGYILHLKTIQERWDQGFTPHRSDFNVELKKSLEKADSNRDLKIRNFLKSKLGDSLEETKGLQLSQFLDLIISGIRKHEVINETKREIETQERRFEQDHPNPKPPKK
jgi:hypothetical protein